MDLVLSFVSIDVCHRQGFIISVLFRSASARHDAALQVVFSLFP